jgi:hypothetical protein
MANLRKSEVLGRLLRIEPPETLGRSTLREIDDAIDRGDGLEAKRLVESFRLETQVVEDIMVDWVWAILSYVSDRWGEPELEPLMRESMAPWTSERYALYHQLPMEEKVALTVEGMRGHLSGKERKGDITVTEEAERYVLSFDPCGSGGRARRGDPARGVLPATERPEFGHSKEAHDWTWQREGVCYYCAHCALVNEIMPIEQMGYPMRVTENPIQAGDQCRWMIYKDPARVPAEYYERVGKTKPSPEELRAKLAALQTPKGD